MGELFMTIPNQLSILRIVLTPFFVLTFFAENLHANYASFVIFLIASLTDYYDGYIARRYNYISEWGRFLDPLADKILISTAFIVFAISHYLHMWMVTVIIVRDVVITILRFYAIRKGKPIATSNFARIKTVSQIVVIYLIFSYILIVKTLRYSGKEWEWFSKLRGVSLLNNLMLFVTLLTVLTALMYLVENRSHFKNMIIDFCRVFIPLNL